MTTYAPTVEEDELLEPGPYAATFLGIELPDEPGPYGPYLVWRFSVLGEDGPVEITGRSSRPERLKKSTKAYTWFEAVSGRPADSGATIDFEAIVGRPCQLELEVKSTDKGDYNRVLRVNRARGTKRPAAPAPPPPADDDFLGDDEEVA